MSAFIELKKIPTLDSLTVEVRELKAALKLASMINIRFLCARYVIASSKARGNGAEKAQRHREICQFLTAVFNKKDDPEKVDLTHPFYKELHDKSQKFTSQLSGELHTGEEKKLAEQFFDLALSLFYARLTAEREKDERRGE